jgi:hypothetical protein
MSTIPAKVASNTKKGLALHKQFGRGGTDVGVGMARRLARGGEVGEADRKKVGEYFPRHAGDNLGQTDPPSNGYIAWLLWGGDEGWEWGKGGRERNMGYGEPTFRKQQLAEPWYVHGIHGAKSPMLAGGYATKPLAMKAAQQLANEEGLQVSISGPKGKWVQVEPQVGKDMGRVGNPVSVTVADALARLKPYWKVEIGNDGVELSMGRLKRSLSYTDSLGSLVDREQVKRLVIEGNNRAYKNPGGTEASKEAFEEWHGFPATNVLDIEEVEQYRKHLADLGGMEELEVCLPKGNKVVPIGFDHDTRLCVSADRKQLYFVGGNQSLDLPALVELKLITEDEAEKDSVVIGECKSITYYTKKVHLQGPKKPVPYMHEFGEENGTLPMLVYDRLSGKMGLSGGSYSVKDTGINN